MRLFGTSGIRGIVNKDLSVDSYRQIAQAIGTALSPDSKVCLATDTRVTREVLKAAIISGLLSCGIDVVDLGILPTPVLALLTRELGFDTGVMVTASHNPPEFNGIKLFNRNSLGYSKAQEAEIESLYFKKRFRTEGQGILKQEYNLKETYLSFIKQKLSARSLNHQLKLVIDPGNGAASGFCSHLFSEIGFNVIPVNDKPDGLFPGRSPEPREDTVRETVRILKQENADLAICFDGDADRVVFCDQEGFLGYNEMIAFISRLVIEETGKKRIATTVEAGRLLELAVEDLGGEVVRGEVGDVNVAYLVRELEAALGVEEVGVYIIPEVGYYPDSIFATLVLLSHLKDSSEIRRFFRGMPQLFPGKSKIPCLNELKELVMTRIREQVYLLGPGDINTLDGLRLEFSDSWMLIRASGTEPAIRVTVESTSRLSTEKLIGQGADIVRTVVKEVSK